MEHRQVVHILDIPPLEPRRHAEPLTQEVQRVEHLGLRLRYGGYLGAPRQGTEADKVPPRVLEEDPLGNGLGGGLVVEEGSGSVLEFLVSEPAVIVRRVSRVFRAGDTDSSRSQSAASVCTRSGLVLASSLYTRHVLASLLAPPSLAACSANSDTISPESVWKTCLSAVYAGLPITP